MKYDRIDREIIHLLQGDIPLTAHPYAELADRLQIAEEDVVKRIHKLHNEGQLRRMGAILRHRSAGFLVNAMVVWRVEEDQIDSMGEMMASFKEVSHCYQREVSEEFDYPLFTMIHTHNQEELDQLVDRMALLTGIKDYKIVKSVRELKKVSMVYF